MHKVSVFNFSSIILYIFYIYVFLRSEPQVNTETKV